MAGMTRGNLYNFVIRITKANPGDPVDSDYITADFNHALEIIAAKRSWPELMTTDAFHTTANDGDITYPINTQVEKMEQVKITAPTSYARELPQVSKTAIRRLIPSKSLVGMTVPTRWYYVEPLVSSATTPTATKRITFDYVPNADYTITYSFKSYPPLMNAFNDYPFFDPIYHIYPAYFAIWKYAERVRQPSLDPIYWRGEWEAGLATIIEDEQFPSTALLAIPGPDQVGW